MACRRSTVRARLAPSRRRARLRGPFVRPGPVPPGSERDGAEAVALADATQPRLEPRGRPRVTAPVLRRRDGDRPRDGGGEDADRAGDVVLGHVLAQRADTTSAQRTDRTGVVDGLDVLERLRRPGVPPLA